jgi:hypothetical protein
MRSRLQCAARLRVDRRRRGALGAVWRKRAPLLGFAPPQSELALLDARLVAETVEQVPTQPDREQPVGAAPVIEALTIGLEGAANEGERRDRQVIGWGKL